MTQTTNPTLTAALEGAPPAQGLTPEDSRMLAEVRAMAFLAAQHPRDIAQVTREMHDMTAMLPVATSAFYRFVRDGETLTGPSIALARDLAGIWRHMTWGVLELGRDPLAQESRMLAFAWDIERGIRPTVEFIVPSVRENRSGTLTRLLTPSAIYENNASHGARRLREMIFNALPQWFVEDAKARCWATLEQGDGSPLPERIGRLIEQFNGLGVSLGRIESRIGKGAGSWLPIDVAGLTVTYNSIRRDELNAREEFPELQTEKLTASLEAGGKVAANLTPRDLRPQSKATKTLDKQIAEKEAAKTKPAPKPKEEKPRAEKKPKLEAKAPPKPVRGVPGQPQSEAAPAGGETERRSDGGRGEPDNRAATPDASRDAAPVQPSGGDDVDGGRHAAGDTSNIPPQAGASVSGANRVAGGPASAGGAQPGVPEATGSGPDGGSVPQNPGPENLKAKPPAPPPSIAGRAAAGRSTPGKLDLNDPATPNPNEDPEKYLLFMMREKLSKVEDLEGTDFVRLDKKIKKDLAGMTGLLTRWRNAVFAKQERIDNERTQRQAEKRTVN